MLIAQKRLGAVVVSMVDAARYGKEMKHPRMRAEGPSERSFS
jgi:hypothetical protein